MILRMQILRRKNLYEMIVGKCYNKYMRRERVYLGATGSSLFHDCTFWEYKSRKATLRCKIMKGNSGKVSLRDKFWLFSRSY